MAIRLRFNEVSRDLADVQRVGTMFLKRFPQQLRLGFFIFNKMLKKYGTTVEKFYVSMSFSFQAHNMKLSVIYSKIKLYYSFEQQELIGNIKCIVLIYMAVIINV